MYCVFGNYVDLEWCEVLFEDNDRGPESTVGGVGRDNFYMNCMNNLITLGSYIYI